jgi:hypothetical protein
LPAGDTEIAEGQHGGVGRRRIPHSERHLGRLAGHLQWIKAFGDEFDDPGIIEVVPERIVESLKESSVLRIAVGRLKVGNREANLLNSES